MSRELIEPLTTALAALTEWLESTSIGAAIIGGVAASLLGRPRLTRDIDLVVLADDFGWERFLESGAAFGFAGRKTIPSSSLEQPAFF